MRRKLLVLISVYIKIYPSLRVQMDRTDKGAYTILRDSFAALCRSSFDPTTVANELFSKKIINEALRDETTRGTKTPNEMA